MREKLDTEISTATTTKRREGPVRRFGVPVAVAAMAAAVAFGGYVATTYDDSDDRGNDPAPAADGAPKQETKKGPSPSTETSTPMASPKSAYRKCIDLTTRTYRLRGEPIGGRLRGKLAIENEMGTTVVVANSAEAYTCNIKPDRAVSNPSPLDGQVKPSDFWFALNAMSNVMIGEKGDMVWAGGEAPDGVTGVSFAFPDGQSVRGVVRDGFWALQYYSDAMIPTGPNERVTVTLDGPNGQTIELPITINTECNQVSHGC